MVRAAAKNFRNVTIITNKDDYQSLKIVQWFLDPLNKNGPDYSKNKSRILHKSSIIDANFLTTSPDVLKILPKNLENYFIQNPSDASFEILKILNNYEQYALNPPNNVFFK